jgi:hypothetical protein
MAGFVFAIADQTRREAYCLSEGDLMNCIVQVSPKCLSDTWRIEHLLTRLLIA